MVLLFLTGVVCVPSRITAAQEDNPVAARVTSRTVYLGQAFDYEVIANELDKPKLVPLKTDSFDVKGPTEPGVSQQMTIINGRVSRSVSFVWSYLLVPKEAGNLTIPSSVIEAGGKTYATDPISIKVVGPSPSDLFRMSVSVVPPSVYPMQKFDVELRVELRELDRPYTVVSPLSSRVLNSPPRLSVPWFRDRNLTDGLAPTSQLDLRTWISRNRSGFTIPEAPRYSMFARDVFLPEENKIEEPAEDEDKKKVNWFRYTLRRSFVASRAGKYTFGRAGLQGQLVSKIERDRATLEPVFGLTDPIVAEVKPLPLDGRPDSWVGVIGDLDVRAEITPSEARVGEPLTLKLTLDGTGSLGDAFPPDLSKNETIAEDFRVYEPTSKPTSTGRDFTYSLRARKDGEVSFPPIELSWFDPIRETYVTGATSPIELTIAKSQALETNDIVNSAPAPSKAASSLVLNEAGLAANLSQFSNDSVRPTNWFITWAALAVVTAALWFFVGREASAQALARTRHLQHLKQAELHSKQCQQSLSAGQQAEGFTSIREAVGSVVNSLGTEDVQGLTSQDAAERLTAAGVEQSLVEQTRTLLESLDAARYGGTAAANEVQTAANQVLPALISAARKSEQAP